MLFLRVAQPQNQIYAYRKAVISGGNTAFSFVKLQQFKQLLVIKRMNKTTPNIVEKKNHWLLGQVDVDFPTSESLLGRDLYVKSLETKHYQELDTMLSHGDDVVDEIYLVDFHRLTIMFSIIQSKKWKLDRDQSNIIEFLTQIILSSDHELYVGFKSGEPVAAAMVSCDDIECLISDLAWHNDNEDDIEKFTYQLWRYWKQSHTNDCEVWVEKQ
ncbi:hypothetical protein DS893_11165 [Vibrionales bacterium C3R12]|nr:hypothetical protein DS893_11165 [Vibrionales bacterium C3R12]